jgi:Uma2 family endonuclease
MSDINVRSTLIPAFPLLPLRVDSTHTATEQLTVLSPVSWETYQHLLKDFVGKSSPHFTYYHGVLEITSPRPTHEDYNRTLAYLVGILAEEKRLEWRDLGSTTFRRKDLASGFEPDSCFYFQSEALVRNREEIDLAVDPAPDLVIEIDLSSGSINKLTLYGQVGVAEIWRYDSDAIYFHLLQNDGSYLTSPTSTIFPCLSANHLTEVMEESKSSGRLALGKAFRSWVRENCL